MWCNGSHHMENTSDLWDTLVLGVHPVTWASLRDLIEDIWPKIMTQLIVLRDIEIAGPSQEAWFHVRRAAYGDRVEVLRLKRGVLSGQNSAGIRLLGQAESTMRWASWCPERFQQHHDNAFLSFLQKLSILRVRDGVCYSRFLAGSPVSAYNTDPGCQAAYRVMMCRSTVWYDQLVPWFDHLHLKGMDIEGAHEYAHWFGHIISGWD